MGARLGLRYLGHRDGASLGYFTGATVTRVVGEIFELPEEGLVIGRREEATLRVASSSVAPRHAWITVEGDGLRLRDLGSTNGTAVNGVRVESALLKSGDRVVIAGSFEFDVLSL